MFKYQTLRLARGLELYLKNIGYTVTVSFRQQRELIKYFYMFLQLEVVCTYIDV